MRVYRLKIATNHLLRIHFWSETTQSAKKIIKIDISSEKKKNNWKCSSHYTNKRFGVPDDFFLLTFISKSTGRLGGEITLSYGKWLIESQAARLSALLCNFVFSAVTFRKDFYITAV